MHYSTIVFIFFQPQPIIATPCSPRFDHKLLDVVSAEQAIIAEEAGAVAVMALERIPADIRTNGGVARMSDPKLIKEIRAAVTIPVMAKVRIGHFVEAQILQALEVDYIDESEVLTMADETNHINKMKFDIPFVCGCRNLGEGLVSPCRIQLLFFIEHRLLFIYYLCIHHRGTWEAANNGGSGHAADERGGWDWQYR